MNNDTFREIVGISELDWSGEGWETTIYNHHQMVRMYDEITGVKNGFVSQSGYTLVTTGFNKDHEDTELIAVTLNAPSANYAYHDTKKLMDYGFEHYQTNVIVNKGMPWEKIKLIAKEQVVKQWGV
jgi:D-alanyl-D-alanine carboxypeptidase/D-alanyl-D-alanine carboxypeptidase (penicillin-binding protein 5/6)